MISPAKRREAQFSLKARKEPGDRLNRKGRKGAGKAATLEGARHYRWEAVAEITRALFLPKSRAQVTTLTRLPADALPAPSLLGAASATFPSRPDWVCPREGTRGAVSQRPLDAVIYTVLGGRQLPRSVSTKLSFAAS